jgi:hypothetical protein
MPEYLKFRCCMCPNLENDTTICSGIAHTPHPDPDDCRFVKSYINKDGWTYSVKRIIQTIGSAPVYIAYYHKPEEDKDKWHIVGLLKHRTAFDKAQAELKVFAEKNKMEEL